MANEVTVEAAVQQPAQSSCPPRPRAALRGVAVWATGAATIAAIALGGGDPLVAATPAALMLLAWALYRVPLRWLAATLIVLSLSLDRSTDVGGVWGSPLVFLGDLLSCNIDLLFPEMKGVKLNGMEIILLALLVVAGIRRCSNEGGRDALGRVPTARAMRGLVVLFLGGLAYASVNGLATGGSWDRAILQARPLIDTAICFLAFDLAFRGPTDHRLLGGIVVLCACVKASLAIYVRYEVLPTVTGRPPEFATNHGDSILFAVACIVLIAPMFERANWTGVARRGLILALLIVGMIANNRRLVWVELAIGLAAMFALVPWTRVWKRRLTRRLLHLAPVLLLYVAAGWNIQSVATAPVRVMRSVVDAKTDRSTWNRKLENWNLSTSMYARPFAGLGFGHEWTEFYIQDSITGVYPLYHSQPHNMILGLLLYMGFLGFTAVWALPAGTVFLAIRSYRRAAGADDRAAALCCVACVMVLTAHSFGDLGAVFTQFKVLGGLAFAVAGKLAVATGACVTEPPESATTPRLKVIRRADSRACRSPRPPLAALPGRRREPGASIGADGNDAAT